MKEGYYIEWDGEYWRSVFLSSESEKASLHTTISDAIDYMANEQNIPRQSIVILHDTR